MKILIAADTYYPGVDGASYFTQRLAFELKKRGHDVLVVAPSTGARSEESTHNGVKCVGIFSLPTLFHIDYRFSPPYVAKKKIREVFENFKPEVVHVQGHFFIERAAAQVAEELGVPLIATNHFMPENLLHYAHLPERVEKWLGDLAWKDFVSVFEKIPIITTPTKTAAAVLERVGLQRPVIALSCGIDLQKFNPKNSGEYLRERFKIPTVPILLTVGRLAPEKNVDLIIKAFSRVPRNVPVHLVIVGSGTEKETLEELTIELGVADRLTFTGFLPDEDLPGMYALASAFITAGEVELQSLVTMEAMATGLPVIAIKALALPELVRHEKNGFLFEHGDIETLAGYIVHLFTKPGLRDAMSKQSLEIIQRHDIQKTIPAFEELYRECVKKTPLSP